MSAKAIFTDHKIVTDLKEGQDGRRIDFAIADAYESHNQVKHKIWVTAFDESAIKIKRLKAKKGSIVDITADLVPFYKKGTKDETDIGYRISDLSFSKSYRFFYPEDEKDEDTKKKKPVNEKPMTENEKKIAKIRKAAAILSSNPFDM